MLAIVSTHEFNSCAIELLTCNLIFADFGYCKILEGQTLAKQRRICQSFTTPTFPTILCVFMHRDMCAYIHMYSTKHEITGGI